MVVKPIVETIYAAELSLVDGELTIMPENGTSCVSIAYADSPLVAVSLLQQLGKCRMNMSDSIEQQVRQGLEAFAE